MRFRYWLPALMALPWVARADLIVMQDGKTVYHGRIERQEQAFVVIRTYSDGEVTLSRSRIKAVQKGRSLFDDYEAESARAKDTAAAQLALAGWCARRKLSVQAKAHLEKTIELDPGHKEARQALGYVHQDGAWVHKTTLGYVEYLGRWLKRDPAEAAYLKTQVVILDLHATYAADATRAQLESFGERVKEASAYAWKMTQGQLWVRSVVVEDLAKGGHLRIALDRWNDYRVAPGIYGSAGTDHIYVAGKMLGYTFLHESCHWLLGIPDEYTPVCTPCIMSATPTANKLCDATDHVGPGPSCWERLVENASKVPRARYGGRPAGELWGVRYPNPYRELMQCPPTKVTIRDKTGQMAPEPQAQPGTRRVRRLP